MKGPPDDWYGRTRGLLRRAYDAEDKAVVDAAAIIAEGHDVRFVTTIRNGLHVDIRAERIHPTLEDLLTRIRAAGWLVAVHNDYRLNDSKPGGEVFTFWLFTHPDGRYIKGEGLSDVVALTQIVESELFLSGAR